MVKAGSGALAFVRNAAIVVFEGCIGEDALRLAGVVATGLAQKTGTFHVWISPGMRVDLAEVIVEKEDGWRRSFVCGRQVSAAEVARRLTVDPVQDLVVGL